MSENSSEDYPFARPVVVSSRCLEFDSVRYDGTLIHCQTILDLGPFADIIPVCPEVEIGLGIPRDPIRIVRIDGQKRLIQPKTLEDLTEKMDSFTDQFLENLPDVDGFIFKSGSPTIGVRNIKIYSAIENGSVIDHGAGFFAAKIIDRFPSRPIEENDRLRNPIIRHHFLTRLFALAAFREAKDDLQQFHKNYYYLFNLFDPDLTADMETNLDRVHKYEQLLHLLLSKAPGSDNYTKVAEKIAAQLPRTDHLSGLIKEYKENRITEETLLEVLKALLLQTNNLQPEHSRLFLPYPEQLKTEAQPDRDRDFWANFPV